MASLHEWGHDELAAFARSDGLARGRVDDPDQVTVVPDVQAVLFLALERDAGTVEPERP